LEWFLGQSQPEFWIGGNGSAVIQEYSKRNLNVAKNLVLAFVWLNKNYPVYPLKYIIDYNKNNTLFFFTIRRRYTKISGIAIMFISYKYYYLSYRDFEYTWDYNLTDSEFGTVFGMVNVSKSIRGVSTEISLAVIQEYSKRNMNVAANLAVAFVWWHERHPSISIQEMVDYNKKNPLFLPYEKDLQKYLLLL
jgi:hypothetical protein